MSSNKKPDNNDTRVQIVKLSQNNDHEFSEYPKPVATVNVKSTSTIPVPPIVKTTDNDEKK